MANIQADIDPMAKFKALVPRLKESLSKLMEVAALVFYQNSLNDNCSIKCDMTAERFEKCLEEFYAICDQIELHLKLAQECNSLNTDSVKHTPIPVQFNITKPPETPHQQPVQQQQQQQHAEQQQPFSQYLQTVKVQIKCAREIHDLLVDCSKKLSEPPTFTQSLSQQQQQHMAGASNSTAHQQPQLSVVGNIGQ